MTWESNVKAITQRLRLAQRVGIVAAAEHYRAAMIEALRGGYTSGAFYSGLQGVAGSPTSGEPTEIPGGWEVLVGSNVPYALFWEVGHLNLFTGRFERQPRWLPTLGAEAGAMQARFQVAAGAVLGAGP